MKRTMTEKWVVIGVHNRLGNSDLIANRYRFYQASMPPWLVCSVSVEMGDDSGGSLVYKWWKLSCWGFIEKVLKMDWKQCAVEHWWWDGVYSLIGERDKRKAGWRWIIKKGGGKEEEKKKMEISRRRVVMIERKTEGIRQGEEEKFVNTCLYSMQR